MAAQHVACDWQTQNENPRILTNNNNACEVDADIVHFKKYKCNLTSCSCICKENVTTHHYNRKRSKSESCKFHCTKNDTDHRLILTKIDIVSKSTQDKAMNVCMIPENMQNMLLDTYRMNDGLNWEDDINEKKLSITHNDHDGVPKISLLKGISSKNGVINGNVNSFKERHEFEKSNQRESIIGIKRSRNKSPDVLNDSESVISSDGVPLKIKHKNIIKTDYLMNSCNCVVLRSSVEHTKCIDANSCTLNTTETDLQVVHSTPNHNVYENQTKFEKSSHLNIDTIFCSDHNDVASVPKTNDYLLIDNYTNENSADEVEEECECYKNAKLTTPVTETANTIECSVHESLRPSLFPNVPPYIKFYPFDTKGEPFPVPIHKLLRWKLSNITPLVVRKIVSNSGFRLLKKSTYWGGTWGKHTKSVGFKTLYDYQKMNHFPGTFQIGRKDRLWKSLQKLMFKFGKHKFDFMPTTYVLPQDKKLLRVAWKKNNGKEPWIIKPPASARGSGIKVVHKWNQIPECVPVIVQRYISNPYLINDTKFDLRLYVLVTSVHPLRIYLYDNGLVRFASMKYSTEINTLDDRYMHLTNYSINKLSSRYKQNENVHSCQGHKWTLKTLWNYMQKERNVNFEKLWIHLVDLVIKTIISGENSITQLSNANLTSRYNSYELFGIDVLFDENLKPWLLEVNISPSLHSSSPLDLAVKAPMVQDLMNIVGFQIPRSRKFSEEELCREIGSESKSRLCYDNRLYTRAMSTTEKYKHHSFCGKTRQEYVKEILDDLTPDDVRHLIQYEDELTQLGSFKKIFPTSSTYEYLQYFESPRYYNLLFDAWETKYHDCREKARRLLYSKCEAGVHLRVPKVSVAKVKKNGNTNVSTE